MLVWLLGGLLLVAIGYIFFITRELRLVLTRLKFVQERPTNAEIQLNSRSRGIVNLAQEINEIIRGKKKMYQEMQESNEQFDVAIHNITHDLRTPLTVASGYSQYLEANSEIDKAERQVLLTKITSNLNNVEKRLESLLEYNRISEQQFELELANVPLSKLLQEKCLSYYQSFQAQKIDLNLEIQPNVSLIVDQQVIERIIENILGNILKHGQERAEIILQQDQTKTVIRCRNQTDHVITDYQKLFKRFYTEDLARQNKNAGLGLYIVKELVEASSGTIELSGADQFFQLEITFKK